ncbi:MAG: SDR family oxidoreductase [Chloroflexi bacterium]|nr:SDR family oxidoreductase [Chloroflexota bacterium]
MTEKGWAVILGVSSGFGAAVARQLAGDGFSIFGFHLDRRSTMPKVDALKAEIAGLGVRAEFTNANAADAEVMEEAVAAMREVVGSRGLGSVRILLHSLAFGNLLPYFPDENDRSVSKRQLEMTFDVMAHSLIYWTRALIQSRLMARDGRVFAMTSAGSTRIWPHYGAVGPVKAALEAHVKRLAFECGPHGITVNAIRAGVTHTPALEKIRGYEELMQRSAALNPGGRLTTPEDVAEAISLLCDKRAHWITGNVIGVDGGEDLMG